AIAEHACRKYSGRIGRTASAKSLDEEAAKLAIIAHIRHAAWKAEKLSGPPLFERVPPDSLFFIGGREPLQELIVIIELFK
ncbi:MAG: DUF2293 domain-containing protein, partial [Deltaproteobacteria bacterium]|nr:DUF2293 domain-containing protein [Deltaproteobacteria bacterium]